MFEELQVDNKNISYEIVILYLNLCNQYQMKNSAPEKSIVGKQMVGSGMSNRTD